MTDFPDCFDNCWYWDLLKYLYPDRARNIEASRSTMGIWSWMTDEQFQRVIEEHPLDEIDE